MNIREQARQKGGDELVAKFDETQARQARLTKHLAELVESEVASVKDGDAQDITFALCAICEALSETYAKAVIAYGERDDSKPKTERGEMLVMAVRSISGNLQNQFDTIDAERAGIADKILKTWKGTDA